MRLGWIVVVSILLLFVLFFYRKPKLNIQSYNDQIMYSPASGTIQQIRFRSDNTIHIAIFLSPFDQHYQVAPMNGTVVNQVYDQNGQFKLAYKLTKAHDNEKMITFFSTKNGIVTITQIAGYFVRRIKSFIKKGKRVTSGELIGMITFGSRVDIVIPNSANFRLNVKEGDKVDAGWTQLGVYFQT
jgi:phosphatidylserine decarboxylase